MDGLKEMVEEKYFNECRAFIVGKSNSGGNIFLTKESIHTVLKVNVLVRDMLRGG
jgi:hypothetical protein